MAALVGGWSARMRRLQNGLARTYALTFLVGIVAILGTLWVIQ
jgi:NADH-quinone oxidoreductase subunit L